MMSFNFAFVSISVVALVRVRRALPHSSHLGLVDQAHVAPVGVFLEQANEQLDVGDKLLKLRGMLHKTARRGEELTNNDFMAMAGKKNQCFQRPGLLHSVEIFETLFLDSLRFYV